MCMVHAFVFSEKIQIFKKLLNAVSQVSVTGLKPLFLSSIVLLIVTSQQLVGYSYANICKIKRDSIYEILLLFNFYFGSTDKICKTDFCILTPWRIKRKSSVKTT